ncbi:MAG: class I SAM-dependent methyltransferase [Candidatus Omnitrophota bacterium]
MMFLKLTKDDIYRDSRTWYRDAGRDLFSDEIIGLCKKYAGRKVLDLGCAAGAYCLELKRYGFEISGADINEEYIRIAREKGVDARLIEDALPFGDGAFDTVILIEVLEHLQDPERVLKEAKRVAGKNILISVPNCGDFEALKRCGLTYEHFLEMDHVSFFTKDSLRALFSNYFNDFRILEISPVYPPILSGNPVLRSGVRALRRYGILRPVLYSRLFAVLNVDDRSSGPK